ncbi:hypothetical protein GCM10010198_68370 [Nocardia seriolae]|nr:hypothetical protein NSERKGN1266_30820 [Nocardia seriolae]BEK97101.1 hypothetical protein NSER024013_50070 [Nocardia seriolae]
MAALREPCSAVLESCKYGGHLARAGQALPEMVRNRCDDDRVAAIRQAAQMFDSALESSPVTIHAPQHIIAYPPPQSRVGHCTRELRAQAFGASVLNRKFTGGIWL